MSKKVKIIKYSDLISMYATATGFQYSGGNIYNSLFDDRLNREHNLVSVIVVNYIFSIELYLKWLYALDFWNKANKNRLIEEQTNETQFMTGHSLQKLYCALPCDYRKEIDNIIGKNSKTTDTFLTMLKDYDEAFRDWRYPFENKILKGNITQIKIMAEALNEYCLILNRRHFHVHSDWVKENSSISLKIPIEDL